MVKSISNVIRCIVHFLTFSFTKTYLPQFTVNPPTQTRTLIIPQTTKDSLIRSLTRRAYNICSPQHLDLEFTHVKSVLQDNGYPLNHINLIMHRTKNSLSKPKTPRTKDNGNLANISVPYYPVLSKPLRQISDRHNISLIFTSNRNLRKMLTKMKTQPYLTPLAMSFIKYHAKISTPHTVVKHIAHFTYDFQNTKDSATTLNHSHPPTYNTLQQLHITLTQQATS